MKRRDFITNTTQATALFGLNLMPIAIPNAHGSPLVWLWRFLARFGARAVTRSVVRNSTRNVYLRRAAGAGVAGRYAYKRLMRGFVRIQDLQMLADMQSTVHSVSQDAYYQLKTHGSQAIWLDSVNNYITLDVYNYMQQMISSPMVFQVDNLDTGGYQTLGPIFINQIPANSQYRFPARNALNKLFFKPFEKGTYVIHPIAEKEGLAAEAIGPITVVSKREIQYYS